MASEFSFDVVSKVDLQGVDDAVNMVMKEIATRFDFKGSISRVDLDRKAGTMTILADDDNRLHTVIDMLKTRMIKRGVPIRNLEHGVVEKGEKDSVRQNVKIQQGLPTEKAKAVAAAIRNSGKKATPSIQGDHVRVSSKSKDELQSAMALLRGSDFGLDLQFENYR